MAIADLVETTADVKIGKDKDGNDAYATFYPLDIGQIGLILDEHRDLAGKWLDDQKGTTLTLYSFLKQTPDLAYSVIAQASREEGAEVGVKKMPFGVQLKCLFATYKMMEVDREEIKKLVTGVVEQLSDLNLKLEGIESMSGKPESSPASNGSAATGTS